jgi:hypothetical protein
MVALFVVAAVPAEAQASPSGSPPGQVVGADPVYLVPTELLVSKRGEVGLGSEVTLGDEQFFVIALARAGEEG